MTISREQFIDEVGKIEPATYDFYLSGRFDPFPFPDDKEIALILLADTTTAPFILRLFNEEIRNDIEVVMKAISLRGTCLAILNKDSQDNVDIVSKAVAERGISLCYSSDRIRDNLEIVRIAITDGIFTLARSDIDILIYEIVLMSSPRIQNLLGDSDHLNRLDKLLLKEKLELEAKVKVDEKKVLREKI